MGGMRAYRCIGKQAGPRPTSPGDVVLLCVEEVCRRSSRCTDRRHRLALQRKLACAPLRASRTTCSTLRTGQLRKVRLGSGRATPNLTYDRGHNGIRAALPKWQGPLEGARLGF